MSAYRFLTRHRLMAAAPVLAGAVLAFAGPVPQAAALDGATSAPAAVTLTTARIRMNQRVFDRVWDEVRRSYYDPHLHGVDWTAARATFRPEALAAPDDAALYRSLGRMLALLDDSHASVASPASVRNQEAARTRRAVLGLTFFARDGGEDYVIERVRAGSPAEQAGVEVGWRLQAPTSLRPWSVTDPVLEGRRIDLAFLDPEGAERAVVITPRVMEPVPPFSVDRSRPDVLVLRVEQFEPGLGDWMGTQLASLPRETEVVLDLRANPGGLLREADAVLSCFLPGRTAWAVRTSRSGQAATLRVRPACGPLSAPAPNGLAVLIDRSSRSAAELTPAALQEAGRAVVVGERSPGAVLISRDTDLPDGGRLTLSRADFVTAGGVRLEKRGVTPDVAAQADAEDHRAGRDVALEAALRALRERPSAPPPASAANDADPT
jgi:carboxyl-terminal processing protease